MGQKPYNESFRQNAVKTLLSPGSGGLRATASKLDINPSTLFSWKQKYANSSSMKKSKKIDSWTSEEKLEIVIKTAAMSEQELGEFLRSEGLHSSDLDVIRKHLLAPSSSKGRPKLDPEVVELRKKNKRLESELRKNKDALAEYAARVILLKKSHEIWGTKEDDE
jgi:transposase